MPPGTPPKGGVPGMSHQEEAPGKTQDTLERLCLSAGLGMPREGSGTNSPFSGWVGSADAQELDIVDTLNCFPVDEERSVLCPPGPPVVHYDLLGLAGVQNKALGSARNQDVTLDVPVSFAANNIRMIHLFLTQEMVQVLVYALVYALVISHLNYCNLRLAEKEKDLEQREGAEMKMHFSAEEALEMVMQPLSVSELQDSSEEDTSFEEESDRECSFKFSTSGPHPGARPGVGARRRAPGGRVFAHGTRPGSARNGDVGPPSSRLTTRRKVHEGPVQCGLGSSRGGGPRRPNPWTKTLAIGTWNVTSLGGKEPELVEAGG
ncbi:hypothetical protein L3Q82_005884 [Scortum barcoo]|uniref:Uncharacterized protein n=1 Tax=Scortum barcoo TaxID=214431 RepID=A0ACB8V7X7_9TELE|nr:hypothetical protein L3Q82_005884 [Scortum barcoo]